MKECVVVLGMHRSGTSVLTGLVSLFGGYLGSELMPSTKDNPKGYFENNRIYVLNEKILKETGSSWDDYSFVTDDIKEEQFLKYVSEAKVIIQDELKFVKRTIIKDPRVCILFPIWEQALLELNINIKIIFAYRSPLEVALSLKTRDGFAIEKGLLLWSHYFMQAELFSRKFERLIIEYDVDFRNLAIFLERVSNFIGIELTEDILKQANNFYSPSLKNHKVELGNISDEIPSYLKELVRLLQRKEIHNTKKLNSINQEFESSKKYYLFNEVNLLEDIKIKNELNIINSNKIHILQKQIVEQQQKFNTILDKERQTIAEERKKFTITVEELGSNLDKYSAALSDKDSHITNLVAENKALNTYLEAGDSLFQDVVEDKNNYLKIKRSISSKTILESILTTFSSSKKKYLDSEIQLIKESGLFSTFYYLSRYPDVWKAKVDPLAHYCEKGWKEGRQPSSEFDVGAYLKNSPEAVKDNPLIHYIRSNKKNAHPNKSKLNVSNDALNSQSNGFDENYYLANNQDVAEKGIDAYRHFSDHGWKEGRDPSAEFQTNFYLSTNPDVQKSGINPLQHYLTKGKQEERLPMLGVVRSIKHQSTSPSILFIGHSASQGGAEIVLLDIIKWYAENTTYQISTVLLEPGILAGEFLRFGEVLTLNNAQELQSKKSQKFLAFHYDLIYLNTVVSGAFSQVYKEKYLKLNIPIVLHVHEMQNNIEIYKDNFNSIVDSVDLFITASGRVKEDLVDHYSVSPEKISVHHSFVHNKAVNTSRLSRQVTSAREYFNLKDSNFIIMGSGTVNWRKGPDLFVETVSKIINQFRDKNIVAIWMGGGEDLDTLQAQVVEQNLGDNIKFTGFLKNASELVAAADIFFLSSREDPFPLVCLEAAQYKIPTVCFKEATGMIEFIKDDAGLVIPKIDTGIAANEIIELMHDEPRREILGFNARNRFLKHYCSGKQIKTIFHKLKERYAFAPSLSVIIPNYNHAPFLKERISSVVKQSFYDQEILILDDASTDNSLDVIAEFKDDLRIHVIKNKKCSGSPFKQWKKGVSKAKASLIWIAESDDSCSDDFVETLLPAFNDKNMVLSYSKSEIIDENGTLVPGALTPYMERAHPTKFNTSYVRDGNKEVEENFAVSCTIVNGSSVIFKKEAVVDSLDKAINFKMCGDWLIYLQALSNGKVAYNTKTSNYFRRHQTSTVHKVEGTDLYFKERFEIAKEVLRKFNVSTLVFNKMLFEVDSEWARFKHIEKKSSYEDLFDKSVLTKEYDKNVINPMTVGFYVHGFMFSKGGIERLAADLANYLSNRGHKVVIFCRVYKGKTPVYQLNDDVTVTPVFDESKSNKKASTLQLREKLKSANLDVFVPMLSEWIFEPVVEAAEDLGFPIIASEHNNPQVIEKQWWSHEKRVETFEKVDVIHLLKDSYTQSLPDGLQDRIRVIQNGSYLGRWVNNKNKKSYNRMISVGRLAPQKRFDRLIHAFAIISEKINEDWQLDIFGDGPNREELQELIKHYHLEDRICLKGNTDNIEREYLTSDLFVLPSEFEGDPVVLVEAKRFGLPCIGYESCPGTNEAILHENDGLLAKHDENGENLSKAIALLINNPQQQKQFGLMGQKNAKQLDMNIIANQWELMLNETRKLPSRNFDAH